MALPPANIAHSTQCSPRVDDPGARGVEEEGFVADMLANHDMPATFAPDPRPASPFESDSFMFDWVKPVGPLSESARTAPLSSCAFGPTFVHSLLASERDSPAAAPKRVGPGRVEGRETFADQRRWSSSPGDEDRKVLASPTRTEATASRGRRCGARFKDKARASYSTL